MKTEVKRVVLRGLKLLGEAGQFSAVFATLNVVDADGDLTLPGAFGEQDVILSQYNHGSWGRGADALPIGVGRILERGDDAVIEGEFNLDSEDGLKTYKTIKYLHEKGRTQEWSYALPDIDYEMRDQDGQRIRVLKRIRVPEVSPCLMGSGVDTRLLSIKGSISDNDRERLSELGQKIGCAFLLVDELVDAKPYPNEHSCRLTNKAYDRYARKNCEQKHDGKCIDVVYGIKDEKAEVHALRYKTSTWDEGDARAHCKTRDGAFEPASKAQHVDSMPLVEHLEVVREDVERLTERVKQLGDLRDAKGRHPSEDTMKRVTLVKAKLVALVHELSEVQERHQVLYKEFLRYQKIIAERRERDAR